jgi:methionyl-tRNA formyltransferase
MKKNSLTICFVGGNQAGIIGALTALSDGNRIKGAVAYSDDLRNILGSLGITTYKSVSDRGFVKILKQADILLSVHGREIVKPELLKMPRHGAVNLHPYLYKYKGAKPVERAFKDGEFKASVGAHLMSDRVDEGKVLVEEFMDVSGCPGVEAIYNKIYPCYCRVLLKVLEIVRNEMQKK